MLVFIGIKSEKETKDGNISLSWDRDSIQFLDGWFSWIWTLLVFQEFLVCCRLLLFLAQN